MNIGGHRLATLSVRSNPISGRLNPVVKFEGFWPSGDPIIFIHGFNTNEKEAIEGYQNLVKELKNIGVDGIYLNRICHFYWPGNTKYLSRASYPFQINKAITTAHMLGQFLVRAIPRSKQFNFIAHSLGCRLILEALNSTLLQPFNASIKAKLVVLMAAAVPVDMIRKKTFPLSNIKEAARSIACIYSSRDTVLRKYFQIGQFAARENFSKAIGLTGEPQLFWSAGSKEIEIDHNDYWTNEDVARSLASSMHIPVRAKLSSREIPSSRMQFR